MSQPAHDGTLPMLPASMSSHSLSWPSLSLSPSPSPPSSLMLRFFYPGDDVAASPPQHTAPVRPLFRPETPEPVKTEEPDLVLEFEDSEPGSPCKSTVAPVPERTPSPVARHNERITHIKADELSRLRECATTLGSRRDSAYAVGRGRARLSERAKAGARVAHELSETRRRINQEAEELIRKSEEKCDHELATAAGVAFVYKGRIYDFDEE